MNDKTDVVSRAKELALKAHDGLWLYNKEGKPVSDHLEEVVQLVGECGGTPDEIATAWLHDAVEDTNVTLEQVRAECGEAVAVLVEGLTDPVEYAAKELSVRKELQAERVKDMSAGVKLVKLADQASNCRLAGTTHRSWDTKTLLVYIEGTRQVANSCKGVSEDLDKIFDRYYETSKAKLLSEFNQTQ